MSINPQYVDAILAGTKRVEFRKRRLAADVTTVVIYATLPVGRIVGTFEVLGYDVAPPAELWDRHGAHAGIGVDGYNQYFSRAATAVGILIGSVQQLTEPRPVTDVVGVSRPPQSFHYLTSAQAEVVRTWTHTATPGRDTLSLRCGTPQLVAKFFASTTGTLQAAAKVL